MLVHGQTQQSTFVGAIGPALPVGRRERGLRGDDTGPPPQRRRQGEMNKGAEGKRGSSGVRNRDGAHATNRGSADTTQGGRALEAHQRNGGVRKARRRDQQREQRQTGREKGARREGAESRMARANKATLRVSAQAKATTRQERTWHVTPHKPHKEKGKWVEHGRSPGSHTTTLPA